MLRSLSGRAVRSHHVFRSHRAGDASIHKKVWSALQGGRRTFSSSQPGSTSSKNPYHGSFKSRLRSILLQPRKIPVPRWISPQHYTITLSELCGHSSFILVAISYAVDDYLQLRIIAVAGASVMLFFTYFHPHGRVLWLPFQWNALFIAINTYRIGKVLLDRWTAEQLPSYLRKIREEHFYILDPPDFARLVRLGKLETFREGDILVRQGEMNSCVRLVIAGELSVLRDGQVTYRLEAGNFVSEAGLHAGLVLPGEVESCCTVSAKHATKTICWDRNELVDLFQREKQLARALKSVLSWDIVRKLKGQREMLSSVKDPEKWTAKRTEQNQHRYTAILQNMLRNPKLLKRREELENYRVIHHIDDEYHERALLACGWTLEEFERGQKGERRENYPTEQEEPPHNLKRIMQRVFG